MNRDLLQPINRPQYVATPEALVSALAWRNHEWPDRAGGGNAKGLMYRSEGGSSRSRVTIVNTYPNTDHDLSGFSSALNGFSPDSGLVNSHHMATAFADAILGIRAQKGTMQPAAPMTRSLALLQDLRGYQKTKNPPDLGLILEQLYQLGVVHGRLVEAPSTRWLSAADAKTAGDPVLSRLDAAVKHSLLPSNIVETPIGRITGTGDGQASPFTWFTRSWDALTSDSWTNALPARVWVDWCCTVLRLALGLGFLWEASWYDLYARSQFLGENRSVSEISKQIDGLMPWAPSDSQIGVRDIASVLLGRVRKGDAVRKLVQTNPDASSDDLQRVWSNPGTAGNNVWEAIKYALKTREQSGRFADHFGMLEQRGRWLFINPGTEWIVVIASLATGAPGEVTDAQTVMTHLHEMGLRPELRDLVILLEAAGLARGSADADYGLEVHSAY